MTSPLWAIEDSLHDAHLQEQLQYLEKQGLPLPGSGVQLVSPQALHVPTWMKEKRMLEARQKSKLGYVREDTPRAKELLDYKKIAQVQMAKYSAPIPAWRTVLRVHPSELKMAYSFVSVPESTITNFIGIAPVGIYTKKGWSGAVEFFETKFAYCAYTEKNLSITHGASRIAKDIVTDTVNGKITLSDIRGSEATGFLYQTTWFDPIFERTLECATRQYSAETMSLVFELAKRIDMQ